MQRKSKCRSADADQLDPVTPANDEHCMSVPSSPLAAAQPGCTPKTHLHGVHGTTVRSNCEKIFGRMQEADAQTICLAQRPLTATLVCKGEHCRRQTNIWPAATAPRAHDGDDQLTRLIVNCRTPVRNPNTGAQGCHGNRGGKTRTGGRAKVQFDKPTLNNTSWWAYEMLPTIDNTYMAAENCHR